MLAVENGAAGTIVGAGLVALAAPLARGRRRALLAAAGLVLASLALDDDAIALPGPRGRRPARGVARDLRPGVPRQRRSRDEAADRARRRAARRRAGRRPGAGGRAPRAPARRDACWSARACSPRARCALARRRERRSPPAARAARIVAEHATDTLAPFALRADKQFFFAADGRSFIAYRVLAGVALVSGDPVGDEAGFPALVEAFARFAERRGWVLGVLGASTQRLPLWRDAGLRAHYTGDEAIVDPAAFSLEGRAIRKVRQSVARLERAGYSSQVVRSGAIDEPLAERIAEIAVRWRGDRCETGYSMAFAGAAVDRARDDLYVIARDAAGEPRGFLHFGTVPGGRALSLSSMRRERDTPNGLNEFLICRALEYAREHGIERVSLNFAAFALLLDPRRRSIRSRAPSGACWRGSPGASSSSGCSRSTRSSSPSGRRATRPTRASRRFRASRSRRCSPRPT